jgi:hypothetical protein
MPDPDTANIMLLLLPAACAIAAAICPCLGHEFNGGPQLNAEYEASLELHDCPLLPVVRAQWLQGCHVFQVTEHAGMSLADLVKQEGWQLMSWDNKVQVIRQIIADVLMGLVCNVHRVSA